ncbi:MAG: hypothetical protein JWN08_1018 [Frankiales bacterium]|nr:hypothetical protein [Frankiales bacterium]
MLDVAPAGRLPGGPLVAGGALLLALVGTALVLPEGAPGPLDVRLRSLDGSALRGEAFVRLNVGVQADGVRELGEVRLSLAGTSALGSAVEGLHDDGTATVQVDLVPNCPAAVEALASGTLDVNVVDDRGRSRLVQLPLPTDGPLERLVRFRCSV